jgi:DNA-binding XRE family transcriptional regulator
MLKPGQYLLKVRKSREMLQKTVSEHIGISAQFYGRIEKDEVELPLKLVKKCCDFLGADKKKYLRYRVESYKLKITKETK